MKLALLLLYAATILLPVKKVNRHQTIKANTAMETTFAPLQCAKPAATATVATRKPDTSFPPEINKYSMPVIVIIE